MAAATSHMPAQHGLRLSCRSIPPNPPLGAVRRAARGCPRALSTVPRWVAASSSSSSRAVDDGRNPSTLDELRASLARQVEESRAALWNGRMEERAKILRGLGASLMVAGGRSWELRFRQLQSFKSDHGHCMVPVGHASYPQLAAWMEEQRALFRQDKLSPARQNRLSTLGMTLTPG